MLEKKREEIVNVTVEPVVGPKVKNCGTKVGAVEKLVSSSKSLSKTINTGTYLIYFSVEESAGTSNFYIRIQSQE